jgi:hypothetical protein
MITDCAGPGPFLDPAKLWALRYAVNSELDRKTRFPALTAWLYTSESVNRDERIAPVS